MCQTMDRVSDWSDELFCQWQYPETKLEHVAARCLQEFPENNFVIRKQLVFIFLILNSFLSSFFFVELYCLKMIDVWWIGKMVIASNGI